MTRTTQIEWHEDRPLIHFGNPGATYWSEPKPKKKSKKKKSKKETK